MSIDPGQLDGPTLSPSTMALLYVGYDAGDDAVLEVRRERRRFVRRWAVYSVLAALLLAVIPALVVVGRTEPAYLTNWVLLVAGIAFVLVVAIGIGGAWLWSRSAAGRRQFDAPVLTITSNGLVIPTRTGVVRSDWNEVTAARLYGHREVFLAVQVVPPPTEHPDSEPDLHAGNDPVVAAPEVGEPMSDSAEPAQDEAPRDAPINADGHYTGGPVGAGVEQTPAVTGPEPTAERAGPASLPDDSWAENLYGARFVIDLRGCSPSISDICETITAVTHGRLDPADS